jgi:tRNA (uracil-5-)-methyltransferase TRM9
LFLLHGFLEKKMGFLEKKMSFPQFLMDIPQVEREYVLDTYNKISEKWDETRYKVWPAVEKFLSSLEEGSRVVDVGCGNGKNMTDSRLNFYGCDISSRQIEVCASKGFDLSKLAVADMCNLPYEECAFDHLISIATFHHLSTEGRRIEALREMLRVIKGGGRILISVWKFSQLDKHGLEKFSNKDDFVPFNVKGEIYRRYYHLYDVGEFERLLERFVREGEVEIISVVDDHDNFFYELEKFTPRL